jgi:hypothetical protein
LRLILTDRAYLGEAVGNRRQYERKNGKKVCKYRPAEVTIPLPAGLIPALIGRQQFDRVQRVLAYNARHASRSTRAPETFLLRAGLVVCGYCGAPIASRMQMIGKDKPPYPLYITAGDNGKSGHCGRSFSVSAKNLDAAVWEWAINIMLRPSEIVERVAALRDEDKAGPELAALDASLARVMKEQENLARTLGRFDDEEAAAPTIARMNALSRERKQLAEERAALVAQREAWEQSQATLNEIIRHMEELRAGVVTEGAGADLTKLGIAALRRLRAMPYHEKRSRLQRLGVTVKLYDREHSPRYVIQSAIQRDIATMETSTSRG